MNNETTKKYTFQITHRKDNQIIREFSNQYNKYLYLMTDSRVMRNKLRREMRETGSIVYNGYIITRTSSKEINFHDGFPPAIPKKNKNSTWVVLNTKTGVEQEVPNLSEFLRRAGFIYETKKELSYLYSLVKIGPIELGHFEITRINRTVDKMFDPYAALLSDTKKTNKRKSA